MLKILQARFQKYVTSELPDVQLGLKKAEEPEIKLPTSVGSSKKAREFHKNIYFCFNDYAKAFDCVDHHKLWKILKQMGLPDHLTCLPRNLCASQQATVRTRYGTTDWFQIGKGVRQGCILSPCLFNLYAEYIMRKCFVHLMRRTASFEKTLMMGKTEGGRRRGRQRMRCLAGITNSMDMSLSKLRELVTGKPGGLQSMD